MSETEEAHVRGLLLAAAEADGWPQLAADGPLPPELSGGPYLLGHADGELAAFGRLNEAGDAFGRQVAEAIVHPERRGRGHGGVMLAAVQARSTGTLRAWSHGDHPAAVALARARRFERVRELHRMGVALTADLPQVVLPEGATLRAFRPGVDEQPLVDVNAKAFSWHPEQGAMTVRDVEAAERDDWFDPAGLFVAESFPPSAPSPSAPEREQRLVGFHWTKVHPAAEGEDPVGEVYVVGVDPDAHGGGLGRALTIAGLDYLRKRGLRRVILYVEGDNAAALAVYRKLGFEVETTAVQYEHTVSADARTVTG